MHTVADGMCVSYSGPGEMSRCRRPGGCDTWKGVTLCYDDDASKHLHRTPHINKLCYNYLPFSFRSALYS